MKFYIRTQDLELADDRCDLGDSVPARIYLYPHKDMLPDLTECSTFVMRKLTDHPSGMNPEGQ